ncbi:MAG: ABC transporter permease [Trueperaceae bacterium]|nr:ABC transporter permease [Trueperaceae bacterium]
MNDPRRRIGHYLAAATKGLWGRERAVVKEELEAHIEARVAAHLLAGMTEEAAVEATLAELGASKSVGSDMARVYAPQVVMGAAARGAWRQLWTRLVESLLIVVALALGVGVIVAVASFLDIERQIAGLMSLPLEAREISIQSVENGELFQAGETVGVVRLGVTGSRQVLFQLSDLDEIRAAVPAADYVYTKVYNYMRTGVDATVPGAFMASTHNRLYTAAVTEDFLSAAKVTLLDGTLLTTADVAAQRPVMVIRREALEPLQITGDPIGQRLFLENLVPDHTIIGVVDTDSLGQGIFGYSPYQSASTGGIRFLYLAVDDPRKLQTVREQVADYIGARWGDSVSVTTQPYLTLYGRQQRVLAFAIAGFASLGLLVASLNVMNLMLARVLRRQSFLGVRRSLGATRSDIRNELILEGTLLGTLGGVIGAVVGVGLLSAYNSSFETVKFGLNTGIAFSWTSVALGFLLAIIASLVFTLYPASVAARQTIVVALKES